MKREDLLILTSVGKKIYLEEETYQNFKCILPEVNVDCVFILLVYPADSVLPYLVPIVVPAIRTRHDHNPVFPSVWQLRGGISRTQAEQREEDEETHLRSCCGSPVVGDRNNKPPLVNVAEELYSKTNLNENRTACH